jgi:hypothetical protein
MTKLVLDEAWARLDEVLCMATPRALALPGGIFVTVTFATIGEVRSSAVDAGRVGDRRIAVLILERLPDDAADAERLIDVAERIALERERKVAEAAKIDTGEVAGWLRHVLDLAAEHGVTVTWCESDRHGAAWRRTRRIRIPIIEDDIDYATALHEIGHVVGRNPRRRLDQEAAAWRWALDHYQGAPSRRVWSEIGRATDSYQWRATGLYPLIGSRALMPGGDDWDALCRHANQLGGAE